MTNQTNPTMHTATTMNNTATTMTCTNPAVSPYWKSVKLCLARPDGSAEIHHHDGRVERIAADGRSLRPSRSGEFAEAAPVTNTVDAVTQAVGKEMSRL